MAGDRFWTFDKCTQAFPELYEADQSYERSREILQENFAIRPGDQDLLLEGIQSVDPGYTITAQDEAEREERREISEIARNNAFDLFHKITGLKKYPQGQSLDRGLDLLFDLSGAPGTKEANDQAHVIFTQQRIDLPNGGTLYTYPNGTKDERTEMIKASLDRLFATDFSKLYTMTDRDVAENFANLYPLYIMMAELDKLKGMSGTVYDLPQSYQDKMTELKWQHQGVMSEIKIRFECIMDPNYEIFHYERMKPAEDRNFGYVGAMGADGLAERLEKNPYSDAFFTNMSFYQLFSQTSCVDKINHEIEKLNLPKEMLLPPEVDDKDARIASPLLKIFLPGNGVQLSTEDLKKGFDMVCFTNPLTGLPHFLKSDGVNYKTVDMSRLPEPLRSEPDKLMKALEEADPWYIRIFTGSKQFDEMKKALKAVQELKDQMGLNPTAEQRKELAERLSTLTEKSTAYLDAKDGGVIWDNSSDAERARITTAQAVLQSALEGRALLVGYEEALAFKAKVHDEVFDRNDEGMKAQAKEEESFARPRDFTKPGHLYAQEQAEKQDRSLGGFWSAQDSPEMKAKVHARREVREFYNKGFAENDPLKALAENIYRSKGKEISTEEARAQRIAEMVTLDIILRERQAYEKGGVGQIETLYQSNPQVFVKSLANSAQLKKIAESIDAKDLNNMVNATARDGIQQLTDKVLKEKGLELPKPHQPQVQQVMENQPKVPEPPKSAVPGGMG